MPIQLKLIYVDQKRKDGTTFKKPMTIIKDQGKDRWIDIYFGDNVNDKVFNQKNHILTIKDTTEENIRIPRSLDPFVGKDGKTKYPKVSIYNVESYRLASGSTPRYRDIDQNTFVIDEDDTTSLSIGVPSESDEMPF